MVASTGQKGLPPPVNFDHEMLVRQLLFLILILDHFSLICQLYTIHKPRVTHAAYCPRYVDTDWGLRSDVNPNKI